MITGLLKLVVRNTSHREFLRGKVRDLLGWDPEHWVRVVYSREWQEFIGLLPLERLRVLEISPGPRPVISDREGVSYYRSVQFPEFDITRDVLPEKFDLIIAEQVFEHIRYPYRAAGNVREMLNDDGIFLIATPFLIKIHGVPEDYTRWTEDGLRNFLEECGFTCEVHSWGNKKAVRANLKRWREYGWRRDLRNEPEFPATVWAYARKLKQNGHSQTQVLSSAPQRRG